MSNMVSSVRYCKLSSHVHSSHVARMHSTVGPKQAILSVSPPLPTVLEYGCMKPQMHDILQGDEENGRTNTTLYQVLCGPYSCFGAR